MRTYFKEYGWQQVGLITWLRAKFNCKDGIHRWRYMGDPCFCGSDNCWKCRGCGYETHD